MDFYGLITALSVLAVAVAVATLGAPALLEYRHRVFCRRLSERAKFVLAASGVEGIKTLGADSAYTPSVWERVRHSKRWYAVAMMSSADAVSEAVLLRPRRVWFSAQEIMEAVEGVYGPLPKKLRTDFYKQIDEHQAPVVLHREARKGVWIHIWVSK